MGFLLFAPQYLFSLNSSVPQVLLGPFLFSCGCPWNVVIVHACCSAARRVPADLPSRCKHRVFVRFVWSRCGCGGGAHSADSHSWRRRRLYFGLGALRSLFSPSLLARRCNRTSSSLTGLTYQISPTFFRKAFLGFTLGKNQNLLIFISHTGEGEWGESSPRCSCAERNSSRPSLPAAPQPALTLWTWPSLGWSFLWWVELQLPFWSSVLSFTSICFGSVSSNLIGWLLACFLIYQNS